MKFSRAFSNGTLALSSVLLLTTLFSCQKDVVNEPLVKLSKEDLASATMSTEYPSSNSTANLIYQETFEGSTFFPLSGTSLNKTHNIENCYYETNNTDQSLAWTLGTVTNPLFQGTKSVRFEIRKDQPRVGSGQRVRSEVTIIKGSEDSRFTKDIWYSFSILFPSTGMEYDDTRDCINQWYEDGSDETTIRVEKGKAFLEVTPAEGSSTLKKYDLFTASQGTSGNVTTSTSGLSGFTNMEKDKWHEFSFHFIHSKSSDGLIEVYRDGVKIHHITGRNMHLMYPKWKVGLYKSSFLDGSSSRYSRVVYFDNIRVGKSSATLADMTSGTGTTTSDPNSGTTDPNTGTTDPNSGTSDPNTGITNPSSQSIVNYTLVNSTTDKDITTIVNGGSYSLSAMGASRLNIRANTSPSPVGVVKMVLSGASSKTRYDDALPYALFGDDRNGDYYNWTPAIGNYTLKGTIYTGDKDKIGSQVGTEYTVNFSIVK